jgi:two-component system, NarL family, response regulator NreC
VAPSWGVMGPSRRANKPQMVETPAVTVVLVDDHAIVREGLAALCTANGMSVLGQACDGPSALETIARLKPDLAILDLQMPGMTGAEVIRRLRADGCTAKLLVLSISRDDSTVIEALRAGADAYLLKDGPGRHLLDAIQFVQDGGIYISPLLRGAGLFAHVDSRVDIQKGAAHSPIACLSPRETEVFNYLVNGFRAKDIAQVLSISPKTVDTYRASLMRKLNVHDLVGLVKFAIERNLTGTSGSR